MITSPYNFGNLPESTVQTGDINLLGYNCEGLSTDATRGNEPYRTGRKGDLPRWLNNHSPDIVTIYYSLILNEEEQLLIKYLEQGVVVMHYGEGT